MTSFERPGLLAWRVSSLYSPMKATPCFLVLFAALVSSPVYGASGASLWKNQCAKCHGADGKGQTKEGHKLYIGDLTDPKLQAKFTDEQAFNSIKFGLKDAKGKVIMKPARRVTDEDVRALVAHVRSLKPASQP